MVTSAIASMAMVNVVIVAVCCLLLPLLLRLPRASLRGRNRTSMEMIV
jgi:hypothetical protein